MTVTPVQIETFIAEWANTVSQTKRDQKVFSWSLDEARTSLGNGHPSALTLPLWALNRRCMGEHGRLKLAVRLNGLQGDLQPVIPALLFLAPLSNPT